MAEINYLKHWISQRLHYMDSQFARITNVDEELISLYQVQVYPNPWKDYMHISLSLEQPGYAAIEVLDLNGKNLRDLCDNTHLETYFEIIWDGNDRYNQAVSPGIYVLRVRINKSDFITRKIIKY